MSDDERIEQLELEVKVLQDNNKGLKDKIDEQFKEIEKLKEVKWYYEISRVPKDTIKAKIAKLEKELEDIELKNINKDEISKTTFYFIDRLQCKIEVLQSLLEKE